MTYKFTNARRKSLYKNKCYGVITILKLVIYYLIRSKILLCLKVFLKLITNNKTKPQKQIYKQNLIYERQGH